jgi:replication-associated recombination protein RarA
MTMQTSDEPLILAEKYKPKRLSQVLGQDKAIARLRLLAQTGLGGRAYYITGKSGTGKGCIAWAIARAIGADDFCTAEMDAGAVTEGDVTAIRNCWHTHGWGSGGRAWIFNEIHGMRPRVVRALCALLESGKIPKHVAIVFTTTKTGAFLFEDSQEDAGPLKSRCERLELNTQGLASTNKGKDPGVFARFLKKVATRERLDGQDIMAYVAVLNGSGGNLRDGLTVVGNGGMKAVAE